MHYSAIQFRVAWIFLLLTAVGGVLLRVAGMGALDWPPYGNLLHTHSHIAFLGWVFNAFFALTTRFWIPEDRLASFYRLFWLLQVANAGMLLSFPVQGYGAISIAFSTLHVGGSVAFVTKLWSVPTACLAARSWLRLSMVFMLLSALGPLVLGPLAAMDLRDSPAYPMSIYWYLHFQYNGWFITFLLASGALLGHRAGGREPFIRGALPVFTGGVVLTYLISAFWLEPPVWVYVLGALGAAFQLAVILPVARRMLDWVVDREGTLTPVVRGLLLVALGALLFKYLLQLASCWPGLHGLVHHRYTVIAFLHLVFLLVVLPTLLAAAWQLGWIGNSVRHKIGLGVVAVGVLGGQILLIWPVLATTLPLPMLTRLPHLLLTAAGLNLAGLVMLSWNPGKSRLETA